MSNQGNNPPPYPNEPEPDFQPGVMPERSEMQPQPRRATPERPIPDFLQRRRADGQQPFHQPAPQASWQRAPRETVVPVLEDAPVDEAPGLSPFELDELEREITRAQGRPRRPLAPEFMPPPPLRPKAKVAGDAMTGLVFRLGLVAAVGVFLILLVFGKLPMPASWKAATTEPWKRLAALVRSDEPATPPPAPIREPQPAQAVLPKLVVEGADAGNSDEIGLGVKMTGPIEGVVAVVSGLVPGTQLSKGQPWGNNDWVVPGKDLASTTLRPPAGFSGTMQYTVALKTPDLKVVDRQTLRLQWSQPQEREQRRRLSPDEVATMVSRGQQLFENGDIAGARLLLQRAAEGGDQTAAMAMAATYDPKVMAELGVRGVEADVEKARYWYQKASQLGSQEAPKRLESLASQSR